jgi:hypothetical protein
MSEIIWSKLLLKISQLQKGNKKYLPFSLAVRGICNYLRRPKNSPEL